MIAGHRGMKEGRQKEAKQVYCTQETRIIKGCCNPNQLNSESLKVNRIKERAGML